MRPLQLWMPLLGPSVGLSSVRRDVHAAYETWRGDHTVFLLPDLRAPTRWTQCDGPGLPPYQVLALPAEHLDRVDVYHVGDHGQVAGVAAAWRFPDGTVTGLLHAWLNIDIRRARLHAPGRPVEFAVPRVTRGKVDFRKDGGVVYGKAVIRIPGHDVPIEINDRRRRSITFRWPPKGLHLHTLHPDAETVEFEASPMPSGGRKRRYARQRHAALCLAWPEPFENLLSPLAVLDPLQALGRMRTVIREVAANAAGAVQAALAQSDDYVTNGQTTVEFAKFWPAYAAARRFGEPLRPFWTFLGIEAATLGGALAAPQLQAAVPIRRAWDGIGLLWALLLDELEVRPGPRFCELCRSLIRGHGNARFCTRDENPGCFRQRRKIDRQRERSRLTQCRSRGDGPRSAAPTPDTEGKSH